MEIEFRARHARWLKSTVRHERNSPLDAAFFAAIHTPLELEDPSNQCAQVEDHSRLPEQIGFRDADCFWKWRELALLAGFK